jgi:formylmethanofuran dehydrogenase subunit E
VIKYTSVNRKSLAHLLEQSAAMHRHLCPRQVLGVRMGMLAGTALDLDLPQRGKRLLTIVETDGCGADGVAVATNCWIGHRTLCIEDFGKMAATFIDTHSGRAIRIAPTREARQRATNYTPDVRNHWQAQLLGYQSMPNEVLFSIQDVQLITSLDSILSKPGKRVACQVCGEEIINERELIIAGKKLCRACAGAGYYYKI